MIKCPKMGGQDTLAAHKCKKVGGPRPNSFRRLWGTGGGTVTRKRAKKKLTKL